jgi:predicted ATPase
MLRPYVDRVRIGDFGCVKDVEIALTPLHALVGPNDSGKSTVLRALRILTLLAARSQELAQARGKALVRFLDDSARAAEPRLEARVQNLSWKVQVLRSSELYERTYPGDDDDGQERDSRRVQWPQGSLLLQEPHLASVREALAGSTFFRLDPDALRSPSGLIATGRPVQFLDERGGGLPGVYDAIMVRDLDAYLAINDQVKRLFPAIRALSPRNADAATKALGAQLVDGAEIQAEDMSEGLLYFLAFAALPSVARTAFLLVEEPENGLHPARIAEVMRVLRDVSERACQVVVATHSPLVVNELEASEVTVLTRTGESGTRATPLSHTFNYEQRAKVYKNGELWLSFCDGADERHLFSSAEPVE